MKELKVLERAYNSNSLEMEKKKSNQNKNLIIFVIIIFFFKNSISKAVFLVGQFKTVVWWVGIRF